MFHGHLDYFQEQPVGGRPNTKPGDHGIPKLALVDLLGYVSIDHVVVLIG
jgi:hypothetical protein